MCGEYVGGSDHSLGLPVEAISGTIVTKSGRARFMSVNKLYYRLGG